MRTGEILAAAFWLAIALGIVWSGSDLGLGSLRDPGSGFMIFWVGVVMTGLSAAALIVAARQPAGAALTSLWQGTRWWLVPYVVALLALYAWLMPQVGFLAGTAVLLFILFATIDRQGWLTPLLGAVLITAAAYIVFHRWLGTQLPAGDVERWLTTHLPLIFGRS
ncbi:MAG: tripartite tricarboxylate transporter TctB family protein [Hyphomonadaceae bacterium]|nr:tripartite tricarboxylate transporter TctB family protein [Hyphomonadaceae bacterium]